MSRFLLQLLDIMRLRGGPQTLPPGWGFAMVIALLYLGEGFLADQLLNETDTAPRSLVAVCIQFIVIAILLSVRQMSERLPQTITALAGTGMIFGAISVALVMQAVPGTTQPVLVMSWLGAFIWSLTVDGYIYRRALSTNLSLGMLVAVMIFAFNFIIVELLFTTN